MRCPRCTYDLRDLDPSATCPECGATQGERLTLGRGRLRFLNRLMSGLLLVPLIPLLAGIANIVEGVRFVGYYPWQASWPEELYDPTTPVLDQSMTVLLLGLLGGLYAWLVMCLLAVLVVKARRAAREPLGVRGLCLRLAAPPIFLAVTVLLLRWTIWIE
ncbi:MAG: hypothetical protein AAFX79_10985 [Planctomycetota bacterium]